MSTDAQSLITEARDYDRSPGDMVLIKLALLKQVLTALNPMAATDAQSLITSANEYNTYGPSMWPIIEMALLKAIVANGGGGGGGGGLAGVGSPEGVVTADPGTPYTQTDDSSFWTKLTGTGNTGWIQLIA